MLIMAKTKMQIPDADELVLLQDDSEDLDAKIMEARVEDEKESEDPYDSMNEMEVSFNTVSF